MRFTKTVTLLSVALLAVLTSCSKSYVDPAVAGITKADSTIQAYIKANNLSANLSSSGFYYTITTKNPTGKTPATGDEVAFLYTARTLKNKLVDSTQKDTLIYIPLGGAGINTSLQEVFRVMHVGETASLLLYNAQPIVTASNAVLLPAYTPYQGLVNVVASLTEDEQIDQYVARQKLIVTEKTASGLRFIRTKENPAGTVVGANQTVTITYSGRLTRGTKPFGAGAAFSVVLGQNQVVPGFEEGIRKMKVGEKATIIFPSLQGYGAAGRLDNSNSSAQSQYIIPPYAPLVFDIEVTQ